MISGTVAMNFGRAVLHDIGGDAFGARFGDVGDVRCWRGKLCVLCGSGNFFQKSFGLNALTFSNGYSVVTN